MQISGYQGLGGEEKRNYLYYGCGVSFWSDENVLELDSGMVAQHYKYTKNH